MKSLSNIALSKSAIGHPQAKSSSNIFHFQKELIQQPLENLDQLIYSKKRYLDLLKLPSDIPPQLHETHLSQSSNLNSINKRILSIKYKISKIQKSAKKKFTQQKILALKAKILSTQKECQSFKMKQIELNLDLERIKTKNFEEIKISEKKLKTFEEIADVLSEDKMVKDEELNETKRDLVDIEKIYEGMNEIFVSVQQKLNDKRNEMDDLNYKYFEFVMGTEDVEELERVHREVYLEGGKKKELREKMKKKYKKIKNFIEKMQGFDKGASELVLKLQDIDFSILPQDLFNVLNEASKDIQVLKTELDFSLPKPLKYLQDLENKSNESKRLTKTLSTTLDSLKSSISKIDLLPSTQHLLSQLSILQSQDFNNQSTLSTFLYSISSLSSEKSLKSESIKSLTSTNQSCDFSIYSLKSKIESLENKLINEQNAKKSEINSQEELKYELLMLQKKLSKTPNLKNMHRSPDSRKMKTIMNQVTILHEELMKKDSLIIKKHFESVKVSKEIKVIQKQVEELNDKEVKVREEAFGKVNGEIDKKNKEIEMLKEILKGNASDIKAKDAKVNLMRKQMEIFGSVKKKNK